VIEDVGIVTKTDGIMAKVIVQKRGMCEGCTAKGTCEPTEQGMEIDAMNPIRAEVGQTVQVSLKPQTYLKGSMLFYGLPLVIFIAGAILGKNIGEEYLKETSSDLVAAIAGFTALILSLLGVRMWSKKAETKLEYKPIIEKIINS
jgi:sigma-E factor negative regulatory protein RseC